MLLLLSYFELRSHLLGLVEVVELLAVAPFGKYRTCCLGKQLLLDFLLTASVQPCICRQESHVVGVSLAALPHSLFLLHRPLLNWRKLFPPFLLAFPNVAARNRAAVFVAYEIELELVVVLDPDVGRVAVDKLERLNCEFVAHVLHAISLAFLTAVHQHSFAVLGVDGVVVGESLPVYLQIVYSIPPINAYVCLELRDCHLLRFPTAVRASLAFAGRVVGGGIGGVAGVVGVGVGFVRVDVAEDLVDIVDDDRSQHSHVLVNFDQFLELDVGGVRGRGRYGLFGFYEFCEVGFDVFDQSGEGVVGVEGGELGEGGGGS